MGPVLSIRLSAFVNCHIQSCQFNDLLDEKTEAWRDWQLACKWSDLNPGLPEVRASHFSNIKCIREALGFGK